MSGAANADGTQVVAWLQKLLQHVNGNSRLELESKFAPRFRGVVSEDPSEFTVGVEAQTFQELLTHFDRSVSDGKLTRQNTSETMHFLSDRAYEICGAQLRGCPMVDQHGKSVRVVTAQGKPRRILIKKRLPIPDGKYAGDVFPEGFKMSLADERLIDVESGDDWARDGLQVLNLFDVLPPQMVTSRQKERTSYVQRVLDKDNNSIPVISFDFTVTTTTTMEEIPDMENSASEGQEVTKLKRFEIEMEYIGNKGVGCLSIQQSPKLLEQVAKLFLSSTRRLLCLIQGSEMPLNIFQHNKVVCRYMEIVGLTDKNDPYRDWKFKEPTTDDRNLFVGCQPESLHERPLVATRARWLFRFRQNGWATFFAHGNANCSSKRTRRRIERTRRRIERIQRRGGNSFALLFDQSMDACAKSGHKHHNPIRSRRIDGRRSRDVGLLVGWRIIGCFPNLDTIHGF